MTEPKEPTEEELIKFIKRHPFKRVRKKSSPRVNSYDLYVMKNAERIRLEKGLKIEDVIPQYDNRYWSLLKDGDRKIYNMQLYQLALGLEVSVDDLVRDYDESY